MVELFRVFSWDGTSQGRAEGGPFFVPRRRQGAGRHDCPEKYGAWYVSREPVAAVAEAIQDFRGQRLRDSDFLLPNGRRKAIVKFHLDGRAKILDLDEPANLLRRGLRPSRVATRHRPTTQKMAEALFEEYLTGFSWWSVLESSWMNVTLFHERALSHASLAGRPRPLTTRTPEVASAAENLGVEI